MSKQIVLKKSELAKLKGLGNTHEMVATIFGVKESEIKDAMMTFGLSKAKPKSKKEPEYVIVLENDMAEVKTEVTSDAIPMAPVTEETAATHL